MVTTKRQRSFWTHFWQLWEYGSYMGSHTAIIQLSNNKMMKFGVLLLNPRVYSLTDGALFTYIEVDTLSTPPQARRVLKGCGQPIWAISVVSAQQMLCGLIGIDQASDLCSEGQVHGCRIQGKCGCHNAEKFPGTAREQGVQDCIRAHRIWQIF